MIVVDTNAVAYLVIKGVRTPQSEAVRARDADWHVPGLFRHEWLNVVTRYVEEELLTRDEAVRAYRRGVSLVKIDDASPDPIRIINLHLASGCSSYDCQSVAEAEKLGAKLVTLEAFSDTAIDIARF